MINIFPRVVSDPKDFTHFKVLLSFCKKNQECLKEIAKIPEEKKTSKIRKAERIIQRNNQRILVKIFNCYGNRGIYVCGEALIFEMSPYVLLHEWIHHIIWVLRLGRLGERFHSLLDKLMR